MKVDGMTIALSAVAGDEHAAWEPEVDSRSSSNLKWLARN